MGVPGWLEDLSAAANPAIYNKIEEMEGRVLAESAVRQLQVVFDDTMARTIMSTVNNVWGAADELAWFGLLPLAFALLVLHEFWAAASSGRTYRAGYVLLRTGVTVGLLLQYGFLIRLLTYVGGGGDSFSNWSNFWGWIDHMGPVLIQRFTDDGLAGSALWLIIFFILLLCSLYAYVVMALIAFSQSTLLLLLFAVGKTCIVTSLVPGAGVAKSWAKMVAMVAAWSTIAGLLVGGFQSYGLQVTYFIENGEAGSTIKMAAKMCVHATILGSTPWITAALFNGVASMAPGFASPMQQAMRGARLATGKLNAVAGLGAVGRLVGGGGGGGKGRGGGSPDDANGEAGQRAGGAARHHASLGELEAVADAVGAAARVGGAGSSEGGGFVAGAGGEPPAPAAALANAAPQVPLGSPGRRRFNAHPSVGNHHRQRHRERERTPVSRRPAPPAPSAALSGRIEANRSVLQKAYPDLAWSAESPTPLERAIVDELDQPSHRFAGWERGQQGGTDFAAARAMASSRVGSQGAASSYKAPPPLASAGSMAEHDARRVHASMGDGGPQAGDVVPRAEDGSLPRSAELVPEELHRVAAPPHMSGDAAGRVEYWSWRHDDGRDPVAAAGARAAHATWARDRAPEYPAEVAARDWAAHRAAQPHDAPGDARRERRPASTAAAGAHPRVVRRADPNPTLRESPARPGSTSPADETTIHEPSPAGGAPRRR